jgi:hypothetical protein
VLIRQLVRRNGRPILRGDRSQWVPQEPVRWEVGELGSGAFIETPCWDFSSATDEERENWMKIEGVFVSDLGSIPVIARGLPSLAPDGPGVAPFLIHDLNYLTKGLAGLYTRKAADLMLREGLAAMGVGKFERNIIYQAVDKFGGGGWGR